MLVHKINKHLWASSFASTRKSNMHQLKILLLFKPQLLTIETCACWALHSFSNNEEQPGSRSSQTMSHSCFPLVLAVNGSKCWEQASHGQSKQECPLPCPSVSQDASWLPRYPCIYLKELMWQSSSKLAKYSKFIHFLWGIFGLLNCFMEN